MSTRCATNVTVVLLSLASAALATAQDWPQFRGPNRDGVSRETGLLKSWPESGPPELWRVPLGAALSGVVVAGEQLFTMDSRGEKEYAVSLDVRDGHELWRAEVGPLFREAAGDGPRSTPTAGDGMLWAIGSFGDLVALRTKDGSRVWSVSIPERFGTPPQLFGFVMMPLVVGENLLVEVGAPEGEGDAVVAFNKKTGDVVWRTPLDSNLVFSSPIAVTWRDTRQLLFLNQSHLASLSPEGELLWTVPFAPELPVKVAMPIFVEPDMVFLSASYDVGGVMLRMKSEEGAGGGITTEVVWETPRMRNHFHTSVAHQGMLCGFDNATLKCLDTATGGQLWAKRGGFGKGSLIAADGHLLVLAEHGRLLLVEATGEVYREKAAVQVLEGRTWAPPVLARGRLYLRGVEELVAFDLRGAEAAKQRSVAAAQDPADAAEDAPGAAAAPLDVDAVVARYVEARGGAEAIAAVRTLRRRGRFLYHGEEFGFVLYHQRPNRYRYEIHHPDGRISIDAWDGTVGWQDKTPTWRPGVTEFELLPLGPMPQQRLRYVREDDADFEGPLIDYRKKGHAVELVGTETLDDGASTLHLRVTLAGGNVQNFYLDSNDFTVVKKTNPHIDPMVGIPMDYDRQWYFTGYRRVAGALVPSSWELVDLQLVRTFEVDEVEVNVELPPELFTMPPAAPEPGTGSDGF